jgi:Zn-dependent protease
LPTIYPRLSPAEYWISGIIGATILFISVLLHELAHSIVALSYGLKVHQIILFIFGGVSDIEEKPSKESSKDFHKEFKIAIVGPVISFVIAAVLGVSWLVLSSLITNDSSNTATSIVTANNYSGSFILMMTADIAKAVLRYGTLINILLGAFNLIPAFPLDGGRVLRASLTRWKKNYDQATKISVRIGIGISYGFIALGFLTMISGSFIGGIWILLIGWFLNSGAQSYLQQYEITSILSKVPLGSIMNTSIVTVDEGLTVRRLINDRFNLYSKDSFPVTTANCHFLGMVTFKDTWGVPESSRAETITRDIMIPKNNLILMDTNMTADEALLEMTRKNMGKVFICTEEGILIGLVSKTDIMNAASERKGYDEAVRKFR